MSEIEIQLRIHLPSLQEWSCLISMTIACGIATLASHVVPGRKQGFYAQRMTQSCSIAARKILRQLRRVVFQSPSSTGCRIAGEGDLFVNERADMLFGQGCWENT